MITSAISPHETYLRQFLALLFRDAVAPYLHPRLAWGDVEGEHTFWMARAHKYLLMPQRDLTVGGRAELRLAGMSADAVASVLDKES